MLLLAQGNTFSRSFVIKRNICFTLCSYTQTRRAQERGAAGNAFRIRAHVAPGEQRDRYLSIATVWPPLLQRMMPSFSVTG